MSTAPVGRFAPTPSGRMHLGNVFAAMVAWLSIRSRGGQLVLRMEDLDTQRTSEEFAQVLREDLQWLGLDWDWEMPKQSQRSAVYDAYFALLQEKGLLYPCYCTRSQLHSVNAPHLSDGTYVYPGTCRNLTEAQRAQAKRLPSWRVRVPDRQWQLTDLLQGDYRENLETDCGDFVVRRADGVYVYQLAVTVDDGLAGVTEVVRGMDLLSSAPRQMYLQELFGFAHPVYGHVPLLVAPDGRRLSKRDKDLDLGQLKQHMTAPQLLGILAYTAGLLEKPQAISAPELASQFSWEKLRRDSICLEAKSLALLQGLVYNQCIANQYGGTYMTKKPVLVVMAAGMGSRYGGLKQIDPVGSHGEAILDYSLYDAHEAGFETAVIIIKEAIKKDFMDTVGARLKNCPMEIRYAYQEITKVPADFVIPAERQKPWGTSHAILCAKAEIDGAPFAVINADDYYGKDAFKVIYNYLCTAQDGQKKDYCMVGYLLGNTVTDNGSVARGVCTADAAGNLADIVERTKIEKYPGGIHFTEDDGATWTDLSADTIVSMNMWGFTPSFLDVIADQFPGFLAQQVPQNPAKAEFLLPRSVDAMLKADQATVKVLKSEDRWYGVTYAADKPMVVAALAGLHAQGKYPDGLWK